MCALDATETKNVVGNKISGMMALEINSFATEIAIQSRVERGDVVVAANLSRMHWLPFHTFHSFFSITS